MNQKYKDILSQYIKLSGLTLKEIACYCKRKGQKIDPSYISKLQNGHLPPPSEEVSRALAEILGCNPDTLIYRGYIEKAPLIIRQKLSCIGDDFLHEFSLVERIRNLSPLYKEKIIKELQWLEKLDANESF